MGTIVYLTCPNCDTVYAVRAAMLRDGQGEVRCGTCRLIFNALDCLSDDLPTARAARDTVADAAVKPEAHEGADPADESAIDSADKRVLDDAPAASFGGMQSTSVGQALLEDLQDLHGTNPPVARHTGLWISAVLGLLTLAFQYLWFAPEDLSRRFPLVASQVESFCMSAGCMTRDERLPEFIRVISRDVRAHPRYEGALLVTATFSNTATWAQPFPGLRFSLYDVNGRTIAARTFSPQQYLGGVLPADAPLPPGQPVQVALEMLAPEDAAVSFEFTFL
ncbi:MAG: putative Zn finger-like uncharacterized protein [Gammaproteobacteria bacterium]|jgi:predicted Zn finger-like uncharacterized protein